MSCTVSTIDWRCTLSNLPFPSWSNHLSSANPIKSDLAWTIEKRLLYLKNLNGRFILADLPDWAWIHGLVCLSSWMTLDSPCCKFLIELFICWFTDWFQCLMLSVIILLDWYQYSAAHLKDSNNDPRTNVSRSIFIETRRRVSSWDRFSGSCIFWFQLNERQIFRSYFKSNVFSDIKVCLQTANAGEDTGIRVIGSSVYLLLRSYERSVSAAFLVRPKFQ